MREQIHSEILNSVMESILIVDNDNIIVFSNPTLHQLFEVDKDKDLTGSSFLDFVSEDHWDIVRGQTRTRKNGESSRYELKIVTAKNNVKWVAHSLKGSAANIGAKAFLESMRDIEAACAEEDPEAVGKKVRNSIGEYNLLKSEIGR